VHEGDTEGGTLGLARADIPGLTESFFGGASPRAGGKVDITYKAPSTHGSAHGHAEQSMFGRLARRLRGMLKGNPPELTRSQLEGKTVWGLVEQEVCSTCRQGTDNPGTEAGVIKQFSTEFPELRIELRALDTSEVVVVQGGKRLN